MDSIAISDIILCIILLSACISLIPIIKHEIKIVKVEIKKRLNKTNYMNSTLSALTGKALREKYNNGFMLSYFILIILIVMIILIIVMRSILYGH